MMIGDFPGGHGNIEGPVSPHNYKRAVYRQAPSRFAVEMLGPARQGGNYSFGMRISAAARFDGVSFSSRGSHSEYEVWRRWEDCLWFQETMELEYERLARQKRQRLFKGKGVKKNGIYLQDQAASFESLPPGPDPHSIAQDIHDTIPRLTKKGTLFRASQATIDQRQKELTTLVEGLFRDDVPMLIHELRASRICTDFFGYWRRDHDLAMKKNPKKDPGQRNSVSSSVFSMYFAQSSPSDRRDSTIPPVPTSPSRSSISTSRPRASSAATTSTTDSLSAPSSGYAFKAINLSSDEDLPRSNASQSSSCSSSAPSSRDSHGSIISTMSFILPDDAAVVVDHNAKVAPDYPFILGRPSMTLESLPEDPDSVTKVESNPPPVRPRMRRPSSASDHPHRSMQIYGTPPQSTDALDPSLLSDQRSLAPSRRSLRDSWASGTSIIDDLGMVLDDDRSIRPSRRTRDSMSSIATFMTSNSAEAVIPRSHPNSPNLPRSLSPSSRRYRPMSLSDESELDDDIDPCLYDEFPMPQSISLSPASRYAAVGHLSPRLTRSSVHLSPTPTPPSPTGSTFTAVSHLSWSSSLSNGSSLLLKAAYGSTIILVRAAADEPLWAVRARIVDKFANQDIRLPENWVLHLVLPTPPNGPADTRAAAGKARTRASSLVSVTDESRLRAVRSQQEWESISLPSEGSKLTIRIMDAEAN